MTAGSRSRACDRSQAALGLQLAVDALEVIPHRADRNRQFVRDLSGRQARRKQLSHLQLALAETLDQWHRVARDCGTRQGTHAFGCRLSPVPSPSAPMLRSGPAGQYVRVSRGDRLPLLSDPLVTSLVPALQMLRPPGGLRQPITHGTALVPRRSWLKAGREVTMTGSMRQGVFAHVLFVRQGLVERAGRMHPRVGEYVDKHAVAVGRRAGEHDRVFACLYDDEAAHAPDYAALPCRREQATQSAITSSRPPCTAPGRARRVH